MSDKQKATIVLIGIVLSLAAFLIYAKVNDCGPGYVAVNDGYHHGCVTQKEWDEVQER